MKKSPIAELLRLTLVGLCLVLISDAQHPGSLDRTFGNAGLSYPDPGNLVGNHFSWADDMELQADGKIVVTGRYGGDWCYYGGWDLPCDIYLARFLPNGRPDTSFGTEGQVIVYPGSAGYRSYFGSNPAIQPDGKIVVVGSFYDQYVLRFLPNGTLDTTFGTGGELTSADMYLGDVAVQPDGKIVLVGWQGQGSEADFAAARLNPDVSFDASFGVDGKSRADFKNLVSGAYGVALQRDGKIVAIGSISDQSPNNNNIALVRYNVDGSLDASFGEQGKVSTTYHTDDTRDIVTQKDQKLVVAGTASNGGMLMRLESDGSFDNSFGSGGVVYRQDLPLHGIAVQQDGKIVAGGASSVDFSHQHALSRFLENGTPDTSFGEIGDVYTSFPDMCNFSFGGEIRALSIQPDGKIIGAGACVIGGCSEYCYPWIGYPLLLDISPIRFPHLILTAMAKRMLVLLVRTVE